jgi:hypothetical protein
MSSYLKEKVADPVQKTDIKRRWVIRRADHATPLYPQKMALNFADKSRSLSRYRSLAD